MSQEKDVRLEDVAESKAELDDKARKMLEDKDADSRMRIYEGPLGKAIIVLLCVWTAFQLYFTTIGAISAINLRAIHGYFAFSSLMRLSSISTRCAPPVSACVTAEAGAPDMIHAPSMEPFCSISAASVKVMYSALMSSGKERPAAVKWVSHSL